jgi:hypothetical protein
MNHVNTWVRPHKAASQISVDLIQAPKLRERKNVGSLLADKAAVRTSRAVSASLYARRAAGRRSAGDQRYRSCVEVRLSLEGRPGRVRSVEDAVQPVRALA